MKKNFLLSFLVGVFFLSLSIQLNSFSIKYFEKSFIENQIEAETGKDIEELKEVSLRLIDYLKLKGGNELLEKDFNKREILHMEDVQVLFRYLKYLKYGSLIVGLFLAVGLWKKYGIKFIKSFSNFISLNYIFPIILGLLIYFNFEKYFTYFHLILFDNDLWLLDPASDLLIQMLPERFFIRIAINIIGTYFLLNLFLQIVLKIIYKIKEKNTSSL